MYHAQSVTSARAHTHTHTHTHTRRDVDWVWQRKPPSVYEYEPFAHLTSVHINSCDDSFLVSGYSNDIALYDLKSGTCVSVFV